jgi:hypothetical protein
MTYCLNKKTRPILKINFLTSCNTHIYSEVVFQLKSFIAGCGALPFFSKVENALPFYAFSIYRTVQHPPIPYSALFFSG